MVWQEGDCDHESTPDLSAYSSRECEMKYAFVGGTRVQAEPKLPIL